LYSFKTHGVVSSVCFIEICRSAWPTTTLLTNSFSVFSAASVSSYLKQKFVAVYIFCEALNCPFEVCIYCTFVPLFVSFRIFKRDIVCSFFAWCLVSGQVFFFAIHPRLFLSNSTVSQQYYQYRCSSIFTYLF
jgi:hypothetical protein